MKKQTVTNSGVVVTIIFLMCLFPQLSYSKTIRLQGYVKCIKKDDRAPNPAKYILVVPEKYLNKSDLTDDKGCYYIFLPGKVIGEKLTLQYRNSKSEKEIHKKDIKIWADEIDCTEDGCVKYLERVVLEPHCIEVEDDEKDMLRLLELFRKKPEEASALLKYGTPVTAGLTSSLLPFIGGLGAAAGPGEEPTPTTANVVRVSQKTIKDGELLSYGMSAFSDNMGFNFTPKRNIAEAVFWNPSAIAMSYFNQVSGYTDFEDFHRASVAFTIKDIFGIGLGYLHLRHKEKRTALVGTGETFSDTFETNEDGMFISASILFKNILPGFFSTGMTIKRLSQTLQIPGNVIYMDSGKLKSWEHEEEENTVYDFDIGVTYQLNKAATLGMNLMNIAGSKLKSENDSEKIQRAIGIGGAYQWKRLQIGTDIIHREDEGADIAFGANVVPFNLALIQAGYDTTYHTYSLGLKYWWLSYTYNSNDEFGTSHLFGINIKF